MKAKTLIQLLSLSTSLYMMSKDEKLVSKVSDIAKKGKQKVNDLYEDFTGDDEEELTEKIMKKAIEAKEEIEKRIEAAVINIYDKMHIAHTDEIKALKAQLDFVKEELTFAGNRIADLETGKK